MENWFDNFNVMWTTEQKEVIQNLQNSILVKGECGSGKTSTYLARIAYMHQVANIPFTRMLNLCVDTAMADTLLQEYKWLVKREEAEECPSFTTVYQLSFRIVKRYYEKIGKTLPKPYRNLDRLLIRIAQQKFNVVLRSDALLMLKEHIAYAKNMMQPNKELETLEIKGIPFLPFFKAYENAKKRQEIMDYEDVLQEALRILMNEKDILEHYRSIYPYIQIDQGEMLSLTAHMLIKALMQDSTKLLIFTNYHTHAHAFGAFLKAYDNFAETYTNTIQYEWRTNHIVSKEREDVVSLFAYQNKEHVGMEKEYEDTLVCKAFADLQRTYAYAKKQLQSYPEASFAYRNIAFVIPLVDDLFQQQLPFRLQGNLAAFFHDEVVKGILSFLELTLQPKNPRIFQHAYPSLQLEISERIANEVLQFMADDVDAFEALIRSNLKAAKKKDLMGKMEMIRMLPEKNSAICVRAVIERLGFDKVLKKWGVQETDPCLLVLKMMAQRYPNLKEFVARMRTLATMDIPQLGSLEILPLQQVSGRVFDHLYVLDCVGSWREAASREEEIVLDERTSILYALTHARHLELFAFRTVYDVRCEISPFIYEIHRREASETKQPEIHTISATTQAQRKLSECHLKRNVWIIHKTLGEGVIKEVKDGMIKVVFENGETRSLNIKFCLSENMIQLKK